MQLLVITTPPDVQLACLSIEVTEQQSLMLVASAEKNDSCYMELPPESAGLDKAASRYGRVHYEAGHWVLESFLSEHFRINEQEESLEINRAQALADGDLIECQGYTLMFSDFSPWKTIAPEAVVLKENVSSETSVFSVLGPGVAPLPDEVNDPFEWLDQEAGSVRQATIDVFIKNL